jgi:hypothetical protein
MQKQRSRGSIAAAWILSPQPAATEATGIAPCSSMLLVSLIASAPGYILRQSWIEQRFQVAGSTSVTQ